MFYLSDRLCVSFPTISQSGSLTAEEFKHAIQEAANFPLRPYVLPFLKSHIPLLQHDVATLAKANNQVSILEHKINYIF